MYCVCVICVIFVLFPDFESCTRPITTIPGFVGAGEYGLTHGMYFVTGHLEGVAVVGLLCISLCVWVRRDFVFFLFLRTHKACYKREAALPHLFTSLLVVVYNGALKCCFCTTTSLSPRRGLRRLPCGIAHQHICTPSFCCRV